MSSTCLNLFSKFWSDQALSRVGIYVNKPIQPDTLTNFPRHSFTQHTFEWDLVIITTIIYLSGHYIIL